MAILEARGVSYAYGSRVVLESVSLSLSAGEFVGLIGLNGSGKSTLLRVLLGVLPAAGGDIALGGQPLKSLARRDIARLATMVEQDTRVDFDFTVREIVSMGRTPYLGRFSPESERDRAAIDRAMAATETSALAERLVPELSGGERQRVQLARALAQETQIILLDEPTAHLDLAHQYEALRLVRAFTREGGAALAALHDLAMAARFCDRLVMLSGGGVAADGPGLDVVTEENLARHFNVVASVRVDAETGSLLIHPKGDFA